MGRYSRVRVWVRELCAGVGVYEGVWVTGWNQGQGVCMCVWVRVCVGGQSGCVGKGEGLVGKRGEGLVAWPTRGLYNCEKASEILLFRPIVCRGDVGNLCLSLEKKRH